MNDFQVLGSQITYLRRYALSSILGLVTDEDNDAHGEQVKPKITDKRFEEAKTAIANKRVTIDQIQKKYYLDSKQIEILKDIENEF